MSERLEAYILGVFTGFFSSIIVFGLIGLYYY